MATRKTPTILAFYDGKVVDMIYITDAKKRFHLGCMRVVDNTTDGYVLDDDQVFRVSRSFRRAKLVTGTERDDVLAKVKALQGPISYSTAEG